MKIYPWMHDSYEAIKEWAALNDDARKRKLVKVFARKGKIRMKTQQVTRNINGKIVKGRIHSNGGGFVANTATVSDDVFLGLDSMVIDDAVVIGRVKIYGRATINGSRGGSAISGRCRIEGIKYDELEDWKRWKKQNK